ncbi:MAG: ceramidase domain-containing protein [Mangrovicoccus sp.]
MEWWKSIDGYCERTDPSYWAEPVNALTNIGFVVVALLLWRRCEGLTLARLLCALLAAIGIGSFLFHTHAQLWAMLADVAPIGLFILAYLYAANRAFWGWPIWAALLGAAAFLPFAALTLPLFQSLPFFHISAGYWPVALLIALYAALLWRRSSSLGRGLGPGLALGAGLLCLSLTARSLDEILCSAWPLGTHFLWHLLNALMLGWMIELYRRQMVASGAADR